MSLELKQNHSNTSLKPNSEKSGQSRQTSISITLPNIENLPQNSDRTDQDNISPVGWHDMKQTYSIPSTGTVPPRVTPTVPPISEEDRKRNRASNIISTAWLSWRNRQMFKLLKHSVCAAEHSLSYEVLRKVSPNEAAFIKDKSLSTKVRFRFGGEEFPPVVFFKIFFDTSTYMGTKYISGKNMIKPATEAAQDACDIMGNRKFYEQIIQDMLHHRTHGITEEIDVITLKDYMQYSSLMDETPACKGGKDNSWRKLSLEHLPRHTLFYDVVEFIQTKKLSKRLKEEIKNLLYYPVTQEIQRKHIEIISETRPETEVIFQQSTLGKRLLKKKPERRSKQAKQRAEKLFNMYKNSCKQENTQEKSEDFDMLAGTEQPDDVTEKIGWEKEADKLYEWTQDLSYEEITATPRLQTQLNYTSGT